MPQDDETVERMARAIWAIDQRVGRYVGGPGTPPERFHAMARAALAALVGARRSLMSDLRDEFLRLLTQDSGTKDRRYRDFNQAIFAPEDEGGYAVFAGTDLRMVLDKFDHAVNNFR